MKIDDIVVLTAKTRKGKNKIHEHGAMWKIKDIRSNVTCIGGGEGIMLESLDDADIRWVKKENDPDFNIS